MIRALLILAIATFAMPAYAGQISGEAKAIDSTIIRIGSASCCLRLISVMRKQLCTLDGKPRQCWQAAVKDLQTLLDQGPVVCETVGQPDAYGRLLAPCKMSDQDVGQQLLSRGFAVARTNELADNVSAEAWRRRRSSAFGSENSPFRPDTAGLRA